MAHDANPDFNATPLFDLEYLRNDTKGGVVTHFQVKLRIN